MGKKFQQFHKFSELQHLETAHIIRAVLESMGGIKRKHAPSTSAADTKKQKKGDVKPTVFKQKPVKDHARAGDTAPRKSWPNNRQEQQSNSGTSIAASQTSAEPKAFKLETSSAEAHAKQRALAKERKASKPNADSIARSKKIWERLRLKSHVPREERRELVAELFTIITGRVPDFVFKHDSVRVIQCALKYGNPEQRLLISQELVGSVRPLVESRYAKFLVAKLVQDRDPQIRNAIIPEFFGHVRRLIHHPEASWIVDDIYRQVATPQQKAMMLREWYGAEFALFHKKPELQNSTIAGEQETADLGRILEINPEKRRPTLQYLLQTINSLIQKKMTGFTMLHDAMLQYFLVLSPDSPELAEFLEILKGDIDPDTEGGGGDLFRNLAFTKSGSRLVCLALAHGSAKDRKTILKCFKDNIELMAFDQYANMVLATALDTADDTKMSFKSVLVELLGLGIEEDTTRLDRQQQIVTNTFARLPALYPLAGTGRWLMGGVERKADRMIMEEVHQIRNKTSKKAAEIRQKELVEYLSEPLLNLVLERADDLSKSSFGCQVIAETLLVAKHGETAKTKVDKAQALEAVAKLAFGDPSAEAHLSQDSAAGHMFKSLVLGGNFDPTIKKVRVLDPEMRFGDVLYPVIKERLVSWATGPSSFVVVAFLESEVVSNDVKEEVRAAVRKARSEIMASAETPEHAREGELADGEPVAKKGNAGARMLLKIVGK